MIRKTLASLFILSTMALGSQLKDPRKMEFPLRLEFTPHQVQRCTLSNGIQVFLVEDHEFPIVDLTLSFHAGKRRVPAKKAGLGGILADLIEEGGSKGVPHQAFLDSLARVGAEFNGHTSVETSTFTLHALTKHLDHLLPLVAEAVSDPALPPSLLELNKNQRITSYQARNEEVSRVAGRVHAKLNYGRQSPAARETTPETLEEIDEQSLRNFHARCYRPSLLSIGVVGDFKRQEILELLENQFGNREEPAELPYPESELYLDRSSPGVYVVHIPGSVQSTIYMAHPSIVRSDPTYPESRLLAEVYGGSWFSRLRHQIRVERGLAYAVGGYVSTNFEEPGLFSSYCMTKSGTTIEAAGLILETANEVKTQGITSDELKLAKQSWLASFPAHYEEPEQVLRDRMRYAVHGYPIDFWDRLPDKIEPLAREEVNSFAEELIQPDSLVIVLVGDTTAFDGSTTELGKVTVIDPEEY